MDPNPADGSWTATPTTRCQKAGAAPQALAESLGQLVRFIRLATVPRVAYGVRRCQGFAPSLSHEGAQQLTRKRQFGCGASERSRGKPEPYEPACCEPTHSSDNPNVATNASGLVDLKMENLLTCSNMDLACNRVHKDGAGTSRNSAG